MRTIALLLIFVGSLSMTSCYWWYDNCYDYRPRYEHRHHHHRTPPPPPRHGHRHWR